MNALDSYLPNYFIRETHHACVQTAPAETYRALCEFDMASIPWIGKLFQIRTIFDRKREEEFQLRLRDAYLKGGFIRLSEVPERELVVGAIGKIWRPVIYFKKVEPQEFATFHNQGFGKVAWSVRCEPRLGSGTFITLEVRVGATDASSSAKMRTYYSFVRPFSRAIRVATLTSLGEQLGDIFADESSRPLPGDSIIEKPIGRLTHGITIDASPEAIWPWLVQMGNLRAGWYSYDWLDNGGIPSATHILPHWQQIKPGDIVPATPQFEGQFHVLEAQPFRLLVLGGCVNQDSGVTTCPDLDPLPGNYFRSTWAFILEPQTLNVTRLVVRASVDFSSRSELRTRLRKFFLTHVHDFMERKQLKNLKHRTEQMYLLRFPAA